MAAKGVKESLKVFILTEFRDLEKKCVAILKVLSDDDAPFIQKCLMKCQGVTTNFPVTISGGQISYFIQQYAEAILDFTYHEETLMTNEEFPEKDSKERIANIFGYLEKIRSVCDKVSSGRRAEELLGNEIAECLLWRRGALLYMYCCTVQESPERIQRTLPEYKQNLQKGVHYLQRMFKIRDPVLNTAQVPGDNDTLGLIKMGIYSDTHLLALMYGGKMCYWFVNLVSHPSDSGAAARNLGVEMLETYVTAIETIPELQGWCTKEAKQLLTEMKR